MRSNNKGFTLVEMMVVCGIIAVLVSIGTPLFLNSVNRAKATEAVATMSLIREALREYYVRHVDTLVPANRYYVIQSPPNGSIKNAVPDSVASGVPTPSSAGVDVSAGVAQYFSNSSYTVGAPGSAAAPFTSPTAVDFVIKVNGSNSSTDCSGVPPDCALHSSNVVNYRLEMDNSGRIFVSYDGGSTYRAW